MDIVVLEKSAFEQLLSEVRQLTQRVEMLSRKCQDKRFQKWLTGEDVCEILEISQRSLQTMRSKHKNLLCSVGGVSSTIGLKRWNWLSSNQASTIIYNNV